MLNAVWIAMIIGSLVCGAATGTLADVSQASVESAKKAVQLVVGLVGVMAFWLGLMRALQQGGLLLSLAKAINPITRRLFPDVPSEHPAMSMMIMNFASNVLGLGNAATPFGLKAMVELEKLNPNPGVASNTMALFLAINTSSLALLPTGIIALRASVGSTSPGAIIVPSILATAFSTTIAILMAKLLQRQPWFAVPTNIKPSSDPLPDVELAPADDPIPEEERPTGAKLWGAWGLVIVCAGALVLGLWRLAYGAAESGEQGWAFAFERALTDWPLVILIVGFVLYGVVRGVNVFNAVAEGGREAFNIAIRFVPFFIAIMVGIGMFRASGALDYLIKVLTPLTRWVGMPGETLPMALLRPLSGKGAYGVAAEVMQNHGPDTLIGQIVSTMQGSTETTFYVLALYFGVARIRYTRHTIAVCLTADLAGILGAVWACRLILG